PEGCSEPPPPPPAQPASSPARPIAATAPRRRFRCRWSMVFVVRFMIRTFLGGGAFDSDGQRVDRGGGPVREPAAAPPAARSRCAATGRRVRRPPPRS